MSGHEMNDGMNNPEGVAILSKVHEGHTSGAEARASNSASIGTTEVVPFQSPSSAKPMTLEAVRRELKGVKGKR